MTQPDKRKGLWLVRPRLDAVEYREKLMGSVVKYPELPTESHIPYRSAQLPRELVPDLDPKPVQVHNVQFWERNIHDTSLQATVHTIINTFVDRARESSSENVATIARVWHMDSPGEKFKDLLRSKQYFDELFALLQDNHDVGYFVTDIVTFVNLEVVKSQGSSKGAGAHAQVPVDPSLGLGVNVGGGAEFGILHEKGYSACYEGESIVFMGYRKIELVKVTGTRAKLRRLIHGEKHGMAVMDRADHWPEMRELPHEGTVNNFLGSTAPAQELEPEETPEQEQERAKQEMFDKMADEVGIDPWFG
ncbi:hypothetical protein AAL_04755 [Moelleriella libera RCEF 2490]|uniref:Uncharacterized protein n=1 Tax=Moelleriella libera RCEF 2490 TaxID=1081109 RepID=A0A168BNA6_9HYPO|nr:hypothetical protein AAL_04755 [Moelleriella libera RCEF 2490]